MNTEIHRLLDAAFAGIEMTPARQDLKEEIRANLVARTDELEAAGASDADAAAQAIDELGDLRELVGEAVPPTESQPAGYAALASHKVRPAPAFVARTVVWSILLVAGVGLATLGGTGVLPLPWGVQVALAGVAATGTGLLIGDALRQETTTNHPMPERRASGYALAGFLGAYGLGIAGLAALGAIALWSVVLAAVGIVASVILFALLAATQTNRHKAWVRRFRAELPPNRFDTEPEAAARFGVYCGAIWLVALGVIAALVFTVGWWWAPLALLGALAATLLLLARMLFGGATPH